MTLQPFSQAGDIAELRQRVSALEAASRSPQDLTVQGDFRVVANLEVDALSVLFTTFIQAANSLGLSVDGYIQLKPCTNPGPPGIANTGNLYVDTSGNLRYIGNGGTNTLLAPP